MQNLFQFITKDLTGQISNVTVDTSKSGDSLIVKAQKSVQYELRDAVTNVAPNQVLLTRKGKDLLIKLDIEEEITDDNTTADIIIEDYYDDSMGNLVGLAEDGNYYELVPQEGNTDFLAMNMIDGESSYSSLGYSSGTPVVAATSSPTVADTGYGWWPYVLGALAIGGIALLGSNDDDNDADNDDAVVVPIISSDAPKITFTEDANNDGILNANELSGDVDVKITLPTATKVGNIVNVSDGITPQTITLTQTDIDNGYVDTSFTSPGDGNTITITSTITDSTGNEGEAGEENALIDTSIDTDKDGNTVTIDSITDDTGVAGDFITTDNTLLVKGTIDLDDGNTLSLDANGKTYTTSDSELSVDGSGNWTLDLTGTPLADGTYPVVATVTDAAGNSDSFSQNVVIGTSLVDKDDDGDTVTFDSITKDSGVVGDFITNDNTLLVKGTIDLDDGNTLSLDANGKTYTTSDSELSVDGSGNWTLDLTGTPLADGTYPITATVTNDAGNTHSVSHDVVIDTIIDTDKDTNTVTITGITEDTDVSDDFITEDHTLQIHGTVDLDDGNILSVKANGTEYTTADTQLSVDGNGNWTLDLTGITLPDGTYPITAIVTDIAGNTDTADIPVIIYTSTPPPTPTPAPTTKVDIDSISLDSGAADFITNDNNGLLVKATLSTALAAGEKLMYSNDDGVTWNDIVDDLNGTVNGTAVSYDDTNLISTNTVQMKVVGAGGDGEIEEQLVTIDTIAPLAPTAVTITEDKNNDGIINDIESIANTDGDIDVRINLPAGVVAGDTLTVTDGTTITLIAITQNDIDNGNNVTTSFTAPAEGDTITVTAVITDIAGNTGPSASDSATIDTSATLTPPTVTIIEDTDNDGFIDKAESDANTDGDIDVQIGLPDGAVAGETVTVTDGITPQTITITEAHITSGNVITSFTPPDEGDTITVTAAIIDNSGNTGSEASDSATIDTTAPLAPIVKISEDTNDDGFINKAESDANTDGDIDVQIVLPAGVVAGDIVTVTDGITPQTITITAANITSGNVTTSFASPGDGNTINVSATITDVAGNTGASGTDSAKLDTALPSAPTLVKITEDTNDDGTITGTELVGNVDVEITLPGDAVSGDTVNVTVTSTDGTLITIAPITLSAADITAGNVTTSFASPGNGNTITVTATVTDTAGNIGAIASDIAVISTPSTPIVKITEDADNDGFIDNSELSGDINVQVELSTNAVVGDTLNITDGTAPQTITLSAADITNGYVDTTFTSPGEGNTITVTANINGGPSASDIAVVDTTAPLAPTAVTITEDTNNDGLISISELSGNVDVQIVLPAGVVAGDIVTVTDGITPQTITITAANITSGNVTTSFASPGDGNTINVSATITDKAGNTGLSAEDSAEIDTTATSAPIITLDNNPTGDNVINATITLPADASIDDILTVTNPDGIVSEYKITQDMIDNGLVIGFVSPEGANIEVSAKITDEAGNDSTVALDTANAPTVAITDTNNNGTIEKDELNANNKIEVTITLSDDAVDGDILTVKDTDGTTVIGTYTVGTDVFIGTPLVIEYSPVDVEDENIEISATITDTNGNVSLVGTDSAFVDTNSAPVAIINQTGGALLGEVNLNALGLVAAESGQEFIVFDADNDIKTVTLSSAVADRNDLEDTLGGLSVTTLTNILGLDLGFLTEALLGDTSLDDLLGGVLGPVGTILDDAVLGGVLNLVDDITGSQLVFTIDEADIPAGFTVTNNGTENLTITADSASGASSSDYNALLGKVTTSYTGLTDATSGALGTEIDLASDLTLTVEDTTGNIDSSTASTLVNLNALNLNDDGSVDGTEFNEDRPMAIINTNDSSLLDVADANVLGLNGLDTEQIFSIYDKNNDAKTVTIKTEGTLATGVGVGGLTGELLINYADNEASSFTTTVNGSEFTIEGNGTDSIIITVTNGGGTNNIAFNELLSNIQLEANGVLEDLLNTGVEVESVITMTVTDTTGLSDSSTRSHIAAAEVIKLTATEEDVVTSDQEAIELGQTIAENPEMDILDLENKLADETLIIKLADIDLLDDNTLKIKGEDSQTDTVQFDDATDWTKSVNQEESDGVNYDVYTGTNTANETITVYLDEDLQVIDSTVAGTSGNDTLDGTADNDLIRGGAGDDELNGNAGNDVLFGGAGNDTFNGGEGDDTIAISGANFTSIDGGAGTDTISLIGDFDFDLTLIDDAKISNIDEIDITGDGDNKLTLNYSDLLAINTSDKLYVTGNNGDIVSLEGQTSLGTETLSGITYNKYDLGGTADADIWIDQDITVI